MIMFLNYRHWPSAKERIVTVRVTHFRTIYNPINRVRVLSHWVVVTSAAVVTTAAAKRGTTAAAETVKSLGGGAPPTTTDTHTPPGPARPLP